MKIGFVGPLPPPLGGVAVINKSLQEIDYDGCKVVAFNTSSDSLREKLYDSLGLSSLWRNVRLLIRLASFVREHRPDVVNVFATSGRSIFRDILFLMLIRIFRVPVIVQFHSKTEGEFALKPWRLRVFSVLFQWLSHKILVLSDQHYAFFSRYFGSDKCGVLENFVRYQDFSCSIADKSNNFLYVGRLTREKGFFDLLAALKVVRQQGVNIFVDAIGLAQSEEEELQINKLISDYGIAEMLKLHGARFGDDKFDLFKRASCFLFPSHFENSPVVLKEAMAARMAIIASDISANTNILHNLGNNLLFEKDNPEKLADRIIEITADRGLAKRLCEASAEVTKYDESVARRKMLDYMAEVVNERN